MPITSDEETARDAEEVQIDEDAAKRDDDFLDMEALINGEKKGVGG